MEKVKESVTAYHTAVADKNNTKFFSIRQTVEIPKDRRLYVDVPAEVPTGNVILTFTNISATDDDIKDAKEIWNYNRIHTQEIAAKLQELKGSFGENAFGGLDGVTYQQKIRNEWDD